MEIGSRIFRRSNYEDLRNWVSVVVNINTDTFSASHSADKLGKK